MTLDFLPEAAAEFYAAAERYEDREEGLGVRFRGEVLQLGSDRPRRSLG